MKTLIDFTGGADEFERRLDYIFLANTSEANLGSNGVGITTIMNIGYTCPFQPTHPNRCVESDHTARRNEPDFATPYEYHYLNKQAKSVQQSRSLANQ